MAQTTANTPLARMKAGFGTKKDLIEKLKGLATEGLWTDRLNGEKSWNAISNAKLLRLHAVLTEVTQQFGSRDKLVDQIVSAHGRSKDADYKKHFAAWPLPRLLDAYKTADVRNKRAEKSKTDKAKPVVKKVAAAAKPAAAPVKKAAAPAKKPTGKSAAPPAKTGAASRMEAASKKSPR